MGNSPVLTAIIIGSIVGLINFPISYLFAKIKDTVIKDFFTNYDKAKYTYDYGDGNEFTISRVETYDFDLVPGVIEFAGKFPPEDVGFISGHFELVEAIKAGKNATEEQIEMREHYIELGYKNFDIKKANSRIAKIVL
jgi:hypothetical protein